MFKLVILVVGCIYIATALEEREKLTCYHCYDSYTDTFSLRSSQDGVYGERFERCDKNQLKWNTWVCPSHYSVCVIMSAKVKNHTEIVRTCEKRDICKGYKPPPGVILQTCRECNTTFCNDYLQLPTPTPLPGPSTTPTRPPLPGPSPTSTRPPLPGPSPPVKPNFFFKFNININLNVKKHPRIDIKFLK